MKLNIGETWICLIDNKYSQGERNFYERETHRKSYYIETRFSI